MLPITCPVPKSASPTKASVTVSALAPSTFDKAVITPPPNAKTTATAPAALLMHHLCSLAPANRNNLRSGGPGFNSLRPSAFTGGLPRPPGFCERRPNHFQRGMEVAPLGKFFRFSGSGCHSVGHSSVMGASGSLLSRHFFLCSIALPETLPLKHLNFGESERPPGGTRGATAPLPNLESSANKGEWAR